jgi:HlyD family secretion protein
VGAGDTLLLIYDLSALEARARLTGAGSALVKPGQPARLLSDQDPVASAEATVGSVAPGGAAGSVEIRMPLEPDTPLRAGSTGYVRVGFGRSTLLGALWWAIRARIRNDLFL